MMGFQTGGIDKFESLDKFFKGAKKMWHIALGRKFGLWVWISVIFRGVQKKNGTSPIDLCHAVAILSQEI